MIEPQTNMSREKLNASFELIRELLFVVNTEEEYLALLEDNRLLEGGEELSCKHENIKHIIIDEFDVYLCIDCGNYLLIDKKGAKHYDIQ